MKKSVQAIYFTMLAVFILLPVIFFKTFEEHFDTNNYENKTLAAAPVVELSKAAIDLFPKQFDLWFSDHLPFRNALLELNGHLDYDVIGSTTSSSVIIGKDGWLFYKGAQENLEDPIGDYEGSNLFTEEELQKIAANMEQAQTEVQDRVGGRFIVYLAPNKERIYHDYMPDSFGEPQYGRIQQVYDYLTQNTDITVVTALDVLEQYRQENPDDQIYFKYDTHWNQMGAYLAAQPLVKELGYELPAPDTLTRHDAGEGAFDLARMLHLQDYLKYDHSYALGGYSKWVDAKQIVESHNENFNQFDFYNTTEEGDHNAVYLIGDSFSSYLAPYVACDYNNFYVDFYYNYRYSYMQEHNPSIVIYETVERYMGNMLDFSIYNGIGAQRAN